MSDISKIKRAVNALRSIRQDTKHMVSMELHVGMGNVLVKTYTAIHQSVSGIISDPIVDALVIDLPEDATDRQKVTQVIILAGQLLSIVDEVHEDMRTQEREDTLSEEERVQQRFNELMDGNN